MEREAFFVIMEWKKKHKDTGEKVWAASFKQRTLIQERSDKTQNSNPTKKKVRNPKKFKKRKTERIKEDELFSSISFLNLVQIWNPQNVLSPLFTLSLSSTNAPLSESAPPPPPLSLTLLKIWFYMNNNCFLYIFTQDLSQWCVVFSSFM